MKIIGSLKAELVEWLDFFWKIYLNVELDLWSTFITEDYFNIGRSKEALLTQQNIALN